MRTRAEIDLLRDGAYKVLREALGYSQTAAEGYAASRFPYPKVTRPRVVELHGTEYRLADGALQYQLASGRWSEVCRPAFVSLIADLLKNPTEEVDA